MTADKPDLAALPYSPDELPSVVAALNERLMCARKGPLYHDRTETMRSFPTEKDSSGSIREFPWTFHDHELMLDAINALPRLLATLDALARDAEGARKDLAAARALLLVAEAVVHAAREMVKERRTDTDDNGFIEVAPLSLVIDLEEAIQEYDSHLSAHPARDAQPAGEVGVERAFLDAALAWFDKANDPALFGKEHDDEHRRLWRLVSDAHKTLRSTLRGGAR